ncbi:chemotaxis protein CheB [Aquimarina brevivitae]|uniref:chemotaxis protein CheB n=1 Tax=Aquimarina brevivitae TaxID=323412 RepID=UPI001F5ED40E|nr:chemotaxis protein CheB [Aquimarina brevivitae]
MGASAGGLEALNSFFDNVQVNSNCSYIIIQHLSPDHKSLMAELLAKKTKLPITEINDDTELEKNHIYVIPPTMNLVIEEGHLKLLDKPKGLKLNLPINMFFESIAKEYKQNAVGIILSGTGSDGSTGLKTIKEHGGLVIVQDPNQAKFDGMPQSAVSTGLVDYVLPVEKINEVILEYFNTPELFEADKELGDFDQDSLYKILEVLKKSTALDFSLYKKPTLIRRMSRRMKVLKIDSLEEYLSYIEAHDDEVQILYRDFLIGVTKFFRDSKVWELIENEVIPELVKQKAQDGIIKIWDVGCSTGEETYSLAMLLHQEIKRQKKDLEFKIFATDISQHHLDVASKGEYSEAIEGDVPGEYLSRYFKKKDKTYKISDKIRRAVIFSNHNIIKDPPFNNMDMAVCRNLLIYLQSTIQNRVLQVLHYSLRFEGFLVLGTSESVGGVRPYFEEISRKWNVYRNIEKSNRLRTDILKSTGNRMVSKLPKNDALSVLPTDEHNSRLEILVATSVLEHYGAASVQVDEAYTIIEAQGEFSKFAKLPEKGFTTNLLGMLPNELKIPVTTSVKKSKRSGSKVVYKGISLPKNDTQYTIDLIVQPYKIKKGEATYTFVITLMDHLGEETEGVIVEQASMTEAANKRIIDLEEELYDSREDLKRAVEETETSNEELQATNEELLASNEELQSTNEELQSVNEELHTVNAEHIQKMDDLAALNADMDNLLNSTNIGTIFLDAELKIRKFTPAVKENFDLLQQDIGRHLENFITTLGTESEDSITDRARKVMETGTSLERSIVNKKGMHFLQRISPFIDSNGKTDGVVITFTDIETIHQSQEELRISEDKFKTFYEDDPVMHVSMEAHSGIITECNKLFYENLGYTAKEEVLQKPIFDFYDKKSKLKGIKILDKIKNNKGVVREEMTLVTKEEKRIVVMINASPILDENGKVVATRTTLSDITELKKIQRKLRKQKENLEQANQELEQFVSICSHDLQEPLGTIRFGSELLGKKFSDQLDTKGKEYVDYIHEASGRLSNQIKALLEHSRIGQNLKKEKVDTKELVEVVKYDLGKRIKEQKAQIHVGNLPTVKGYKTELRLLFQNLIGNALKYSKKGVPPDVRISAFEDNDHYVFSITDNGIGMKEEDLDAIFTIFSRVPTEDKFEGTGVGLAHCEKIVKLHGGKIWADSQFGVGSTFYFKING